MSIFIHESIILELSFTELLSFRVGIIVVRMVWVLEEGNQGSQGAGAEVGSPFPNSLIDLNCLRPIINLERCTYHMENRAFVGLGIVVKPKVQVVVDFVADRDQSVVECVVVEIPGVWLQRYPGQNRRNKRETPCVASMAFCGDILVLRSNPTDDILWTVGFL